MQHIKLMRPQIILLSTITILTCWNGSIVDSSSKDKRPDINFYGTLEDHSSTCNVDDILIGGKYEQIAVYQPVKDAYRVQDKPRENTPQIDPKQNKILLDLKEISSIGLLHAQRPTEYELEINNRKYVEIEVTSITGSKNVYIIESSREISCRKIDKGPDGNQKPIEEERKLNFIHLRNLIIKGYKSAKDSITSHSRDESVSEKSQIAQGTEQILDQIEKKVNNLPKEDPSNYQKIKESLLSLLRSLREQLNKMLSMIKN